MGLHHILFEDSPRQNLFYLTCIYPHLPVQPDGVRIHQLNTRRSKKLMVCTAQGQKGYSGFEPSVHWGRSHKLLLDHKPLMMMLM